MARKSLSVIGIVLLVFVLQSCQQSPEKSILKRYFHAVTLNDVTTMSKMAIEPIDLDLESWEIINVSEEVIKPTPLPGYNKNELDLKKQVEDSVGITLDARDELDNAEFERDNARTRAARRAGQKKVDEMQAKYDEIHERHLQLQKDYNEAKEIAADEEEITNFSLGVGSGDIPNLREFTGEVHSTEVEVKVQGESGTKNYKFYLKRYNLKDETSNIPHRGRWIIVKIEPLG